MTLGTRYYSKKITNIHLLNSKGKPDIHVCTFAFQPTEKSSELDSVCSSPEQPPLIVTPRHHSKMYSPLDITVGSTPNVLCGAGDVSGAFTLCSFEHYFCHGIRKNNNVKISAASSLPC